MLPSQPFRSSVGWPPHQIWTACSCGGVLTPVCRGACEPRTCGHQSPHSFVVVRCFCPTFSSPTAGMRIAFVSHRPQCVGTVPFPLASRDVGLEMGLLCTACRRRSARPPTADCFGGLLERPYPPSWYMYC
uniref:Uncharacterized protein n=1 Tax=Pararge aegeria TaxID=116150 RepID=S4NXQ4_9NEOP